MYIVGVEHTGTCIAGFSIGLSIDKVVHSVNEGKSRSFGEGRPRDTNPFLGIALGFVEVLLC
ncbi:protein of unknown function [Candidatus Methylomirabilis oxygeniifera]|uniref:Uncharacterized protein n=1 Tax=Methylomirabilis oxygeniifera TaxID=671143 RepID=D5MHZ8_METO1|nr:protein of unknown function [Candidatus Methylomirabilis oxyfera]